MSPWSGTGGYLFYNLSWLPRNTKRARAAGHGCPAGAVGNRPRTAHPLHRRRCPPRKRAPPHVPVSSLSHPASAPLPEKLPPLNRLRSPCRSHTRPMPPNPAGRCSTSPSAPKPGLVKIDSAFGTNAETRSANCLKSCLPASFARAVHRSTEGVKPQFLMSSSRKAVNSFTGSRNTVFSRSRYSLWSLCASWTSR